MECDLSNLSLDDLIRSKKQEQEKSGQSAQASSTWTISLNDYIKNKKVDKPKAELGSVRQVQKQRLPPPPPPKSFCQKSDDGEEDKEMLDFFGLPKKIVFDKSVTGKLGGLSTCGGGRQYEEDAYKSLDEVVHERGILKPPKYSTILNDNDLPITGNRKKTGKKAVGFSVQSSSDGMNKSLEDVISERGIMKASGDLSRPTKRKHEQEGGNEFGHWKRQKWTTRIITPHVAVHQLAESGLIIELEIGRLADDNNRDKPHLWRCKVYCGDIEVVCDSSRKVVAREMGCNEFLKQLSEDYPDVYLPKYKVPDELLIDPRVFRWLDEISTNNGIEITHFVKTKENPHMKHSDEPFYSFVCTFSFGDEEVVVERDTIDHAKLAAARQVYEKLKDGHGHAQVVVTKYFHGSECDPTVEYNFEENEIHHIEDLAEDEETTIKTLQSMRSDNIQNKLMITASEIQDFFDEEGLNSSDSDLD